MTDPEKIAEFLAFLREAEQEYKEAQAKERETVDQLQDIAHRLELFTDSYHETARLDKLFREVRRTRRKAKEAQELNSPVVEWAAANKPAVKHLERLLGTLKNIQDTQKKRQYHPRTKVLEQAGKSPAGTEGVE